MMRCKANRSRYFGGALAFAITSALTAVASATTALAGSATMPPVNPYLIQDSVYPSIHFDPAQTDATTLPTWPESSTIDPSQVQWLPGLTTIGTAHRPYKGGEHGIFFSGGNRVGKIRVTDGVLQGVDEVAIPGLEDNTISTTELRSINKRLEERVRLR